jgi:hypothetical protein
MMELLAPRPGETNKTGRLTNARSTLRRYTLSQLQLPTPTLTVFSPSDSAVLVLAERISFFFAAIPDHIWTKVLAVIEAHPFGQRIRC